MTFSNEWRGAAADCDRYDLPASGRLRLFAGAAFLCIAFASSWTLWTNLSGGSGDRFAESQTSAEPTSADETPAQQTASEDTGSSVHAKLAPRAAAYAKLTAALNSYARRAAAAPVFASLFDSHPLGAPAGLFVGPLNLEAEKSAAAVPPTRSAAVAHTDRIAAQPPRPAPAVARTRSAPSDLTSASNTVTDTPPERPTIFERLFGRPSTPALAYAAPEDDGAGQGITGHYDRYTAIYDISAHIVYLPDGTQLEAHSGWGPWMDDPRHTEIRMRGATPATVYDLQPRESLFHGVQALRLIPVDEGKVFGRVGLLAHTYMLGSNGQSNGCVSFRNYTPFLKAFLNHEIKRLVVVSRLD
jgi:hypothetical protein